MANQSKDTLKKRLANVKTIGFSQQSFFDLVDVCTLIVDSMEEIGVVEDLKDLASHNIDCSRSNVILDLNTTRSAITMNFHRIEPRKLIDLSVTKNLAGDCTITLASNEMTFKGYDGADYGTTSDVVLSGSSGNDFTVSIKVTNKFSGGKVIAYVGVGSDAS